MYSRRALDKNSSHQKMRIDLGNSNCITRPKSPTEVKSILKGANKNKAPEKNDNTSKSPPELDRMVSIPGLDLLHTPNSNPKISDRDPKTPRMRTGIADKSPILNWLAPKRPPTITQCPIPPKRPRQLCKPPDCCYDFDSEQPAEPEEGHSALFGADPENLHHCENAVRATTGNSTLAPLNKISPDRTVTINAEKDSTPVLPELISNENYITPKIVEYEFNLDWDSSEETNIPVRRVAAVQFDKSATPQEPIRPVSNEDDWGLEVRRKSMGDAPNSRSAIETQPRMRRSLWSFLPSYDMSKFEEIGPECKYIDTHCHLDFLFNKLAYKGTHNTFITENQENYRKQYGGCVAVFCNPQTFAQRNMWEKLIAEDNVWAAFGCHPHMAHLYTDEIHNHLTEAIQHYKVKALGEIGLDYSTRNNCNHELQKTVFKRQIDLALYFDLPLVIHSRNAVADTVAILRECVPKYHRIHWHCFTESWDIARPILQEFGNLFIGLTSLVTYPSAKPTHEVARCIPLHRLLLETDSPYFLPRTEPMEKKFSNPGMAAHVAAQIAAIRQESLVQVLKVTERNSRRMYSI